MVQVTTVRVVVVVGTVVSGDVVLALALQTAVSRAVSRWIQYGAVADQHVT